MTIREDLQSASFDVHGFRFCISGEPGEALSGTWQDFAYFRSESEADEIQIELVNEAPDYDSLPPVEAAIYTPRNLVYKIDGVSYIDYQGRGLGVHDTRSGNFRMISTDSDLRYEAVYLFLLSQIGQALDSQGIHRVHALAVSIHGHAVLVLLPGGGGKSTLTLELLKHPEVKLLSDDSPLVDRAGQVHAFPLRLGLLRGGEKDLPEDSFRVIRRMEFEPKLLLNYDYFADRVTAQAKPGVIMLGARTLASEGTLEKTGFFSGFRAMTANSIVGLGLFQGLEFILSSSPWEILSKVGLGFSRTRNSIRFLRKSHIYRLKLGRSTESNARAVIELAGKLFIDRE